MASRSQFRPVSDASAADWVLSGIGPFGSGVGGLVPHGFGAYARVFHPAWGVGGRPVTWGEVAAWSGRVMHPLAQFGALAAPVRGHGESPRPWRETPDVGTMPPAALAALCDVLSRHTGSADRCWFCVWDGYHSGVSSRVTATFTASAPPPSGRAAEGEEDESAGGESLDAGLPAEIADGPVVALPERTYLLLGGPLYAAGELSMPGVSFQSPNLFWPDDHAWCVATEIDLDSTYLGGSPALVRDLLADERLEACPVSEDDLVWVTSDGVNI
jgi:hypothetical protein